MAITFGTPVRASDTGIGVTHTLSGFVVGATGKLLLVWVFHEDAYNLIESSVKFGTSDLTKVHEVRQTTGNQAGLSIWALANPAVGTNNITVTVNGTMSVMGLTIVGVLADGADLSSALTSAISSSRGSFQTSSSGTTVSASITPGVAGTTIVDAAMENDATLSWSASNGQTTLDSEQFASGSGYSWKIGYAAATGSGAQSLGYSCSSSYGRASYGSIALIPVAGAPTLNDLTFTPTTANVVPGEGWAASLSGRTSGSTISASCPGETVSWNSGTNTLSATFAAPGTKTITLTETLAGATNTPHASPAQQATVLTQVKVGVLGSSTPAGWFGATFTTAETPNARLRVWSGSSFAGFASVVGAGKGAGGIAFGNYLLAKLGASYRVDFVNGALGGTGLQSWSTGEAPPNGNYAAAKTAFLATGGIDLAVCHVGSNDARAEQVPSRATFESWYRTLIANLRTDLSAASLPIFLMGCQRAPQEPTPGSDIYWGRARAGEQNVADDSNVYLGATAVDLSMYSDDVHLSDAHDGGNAIEGRRAAHAVYNALFGGTQRYRGPKPGSSSYDPATGWITINFTTYGSAELVGRTGQSNLTGFSFFAAATPTTPVTAPFVSGPAQVAARLETGLSSVTYSYQETTNPDVSNCLFDNGPVPAEP